METLKKTVLIPENHQVHIDLTLPDYFPTGQTEVLLVFSIAPQSPANTSRSDILKLAGSLKDSEHFSGDPLQIQKAMRNEWEK